jgi:hypothetical protein
MQDCEDEIEVKYLRNGLPFNCESRTSEKWFTYCRELRLSIARKSLILIFKITYSNRHAIAQ